MNRLKKELRFVALILTGFFPILAFLDFGLGIQVSRDYGGLHTLAFSCCMIFFGEAYRYAVCAK
ncbi:MAG: hypothetical protein JKX92_05855 [Porticoccaceae bacterium]|nr:hypothetical protein [Porticoccaceae bacterium]